MSKTLVWVGADGVEWPLTGAEIRGVFVESRTVGDFTGVREITSTSLIGVTGERVGAHDGEIKPIEFELGLVFSSATKFGHHGDPSELFHDFCRGCSSRKKGYLKIVDTLHPTVGLPCVVLKVPVLEQINKRQGAFRGVFKFYCDSGLWVVPLSEGTQRIVTVTNFGESTIYPKIRWKGLGGEVQTPSGSTFILPRVDDWRVVSLVPKGSGEVLDLAGVLDEPLWKKIRGQVVFEGVPVDAKRTYTIPEGAELIWEVGVLSPWL